MSIRNFSIQVPATTANIGSGFDTTGIALTLYNTFHFVFTKNNGITLYGFEARFNTEENLVYRIFKQILRKYHVEIPSNLELTIEQNVPIARGLGSSSTCIIAGIFAANIYGKLDLDIQTLLDIAVQIEGHPDNVAPAILGGMVSSILSDTHCFYQKIIPQSKLSFHAIIENNESITADTRSAMPHSLSYCDAIYNISRASLLMHAFETGDARLLPIVTQDKIHQQFRLKFIKNYKSYSHIIDHTPFLTFWISGSGPTMMLLSLTQDEVIVTEKIQLITAACPVKIIQLFVDDIGTKITYHN